MNKNISLTPTLWDLYNFIKHRSLQGEKTTVKDICDFLPNTYHLNAKESNFSNCPNLYKDIDLINESSEVEKIIVKDNNNFHLATEEEAYAYEQKLKIRALKLFKKYWAVNFKISNNNQGKLLGCGGEVIDEHSHARRFTEAFIDEALKDENDSESV